MVEELTDEEIEKRATALVKERDANLRNGKRPQKLAYRVETGSIVPCEICGKPVCQAWNFLRVRCAYCDAVYKRIYKLYSVRRARFYKVHGKPKRHLKEGRHCCRRACKFCGSCVHVGNNGYCRECVAAGFDNVHKMTGRTNGWDVKPKAKPVPVADGWRGRPCAGGGTRNFQQFELSLCRSPSTPLTEQRERDRMRAKARKARYNARQKALKDEAEAGNDLPNGQD